MVLTASSGLLISPAVAFGQSSGGDTLRARDVRQSGTASASTDDSVFRRAEQLVRDGHVEAGRALVDSLLTRAPSGSLQHSQALYWRASLAADAAEAERGYRRVILDHPLSEWSGDALLKLAQLEIARGDQDQALTHLRRFEREHPRHEARGRASFWLARLYFDRKNDPKGCASLGTARAAVPPDNIELRNQIDYYSQRCVGVDTVEVTATTDNVRDSSGRASASPPPVSSSASRSASTSPVRDSTPAARVSAKPVSVYTVQIAAYDTRRAAESLIARLKTRGYDARLASDSKPYRVRIGRHRTKGEAVAAQQRLRAKGITGFVTEMEQP